MSIGTSIPRRGYHHGNIEQELRQLRWFIRGSREMIATMRHFAPGLLLYSTGLPPASTAAALEALRIMLQEPGVYESCSTMRICSCNWRVNAGSR